MQRMHSLHKVMALLEWLPHQKSNPYSALGPQMRCHAGLFQRATLNTRPYSPCLLSLDPSVCHLGMSIYRIGYICGH